MSTEIPSRDGMNPQWMELAKKQVASIQFGSVQLIVEGSQVVRIETTEKVRLDNPAKVSGGRKPVP